MRLFARIIRSLGINYQPFFGGAKTLRLLVFAFFCSFFFSVFVFVFASFFFVLERFSPENPRALAAECQPAQPSPASPKSTKKKKHANFCYLTYGDHVEYRDPDPTPSNIFQQKSKS